MRRPTAAEVSAALGQPITTGDTEHGTQYRADNGNRFFLFYTSNATAEHIAESLKVTKIVA